MLPRALQFSSFLSLRDAIIVLQRPSIQHPRICVPLSYFKNDQSEAYPIPGARTMQPITVLHTVPGIGTKYPSVSKRKMTAYQTIHARSSTFLVKATRQWLAIVNVKIVSPMLPDPETYGIGNESRVQGRYVQHVSSKLNPIFESLRWRVRMADGRLRIWRQSPT